VNESRKFLSVVIASGLDFEMLTPEDVIRHVSMDVLANHLPPELVAELVDAALQAKEMNATLVLQTLGVESIAEHVPMSILWACVAESASASLGAAAPSKVAAKSAPPAKAVKAAKAAKPAKAAEPAKPAKVAAAPAPQPEPEVVVQPVPEPEPEPVPEPEVFVAPEPAPLADLAPEEPPEHQPAVAARKPNRAAEAPLPAAAYGTATATSPAPMSPVEVVRSERMQTYAEENEEALNYHDMDTSIGSMEPEIVEVEYGDDNLTYGTDADEVTAFGQD
jgi:hypothetical protein